MNAREWIDSAPEGVMVPIAVVRELLKDAGEIAEGSPGQVAKLLGRSARYWREAAKAGLITGAYEDGDRWRLPLPACREHLGRKAGKARGFYGPHKKTQAARARAAGLPKRPHLVGRSSPLGAGTNEDSGSVRSRVAGERGASGR